MLYFPNSAPMRIYSALLLLLLVGCSGAVTESSLPPPHIVLIFTDDQGYADLGCYGGTHVRTPHLDSLAATGTRFTHFRVAQAVCTASRAALLTGCYPNRLGLRGAIGPESTAGLAPAETTLAELLRGRGYATHMIGKWHLGNASPLLPTDQGFDSYYGIPYSHDMWGGHPNPVQAAQFPARVPLLRDTQVVAQLSGFDDLTRRYNAAAVERIAAHDPDRPLFLYLAHSLPHVPLAEDSTYAPRTGLGLYADVMAEIDAGVGELYAALAARGMADNTLLIFTSDNGPWLSYGGHAGRTGGLREGKGTSFEGGVRVPLLVHGAGVAVGTVSTAPLMSIDWLPSIAALVGAPLPARPVDGRNRLTDFLGQTEQPAPQPYAVYWLDGLDAVISPSGRWKLHFPHPYRTLDGPVRNDGYPAPYRQERIGLSLFDLHADPHETTDVAAQFPDTVGYLQAIGAALRDELGDTHTGVVGSAVRAR